MIPNPFQQNTLHIIEQLLTLKEEAAQRAGVSWRDCFYSEDLTQPG